MVMVRSLRMKLVCSLECAYIWAEGMSDEVMFLSIETWHEIEMRPITLKSTTKFLFDMEAASLAHTVDRTRHIYVETRGFLLSSSNIY
jgi:hypothetical protein